MTILVTGSTGTVGSHVLEELRQRDAHIRVLVRKEPATPPKGVEVAIGDLLDPVSVEKAIRGVTNSTCSTRSCLMNLRKDLSPTDSRRNTA